MKYIVGVILLALATSAWSVPVVDGYTDIFTIDVSKLPKKTPCIGKELVKMPDELGGIIDVFRDFFVGIWDGINGTFQYDLRYIRWCYKAPGRLVKIWSHLGKIIEEFVKTLDFFKAYDDIKDLSLQTLIHGLPCYMLYNLMMHFIDWFSIKDLDHLKNRLMMTAFSNAQLLLNDVITMFGCLGRGDFHCVGEIVGQIIYVFAFH